MSFYRKKKLSDPKMMKSLFLVSWLVYFSSYLGRLNFSASITEITLTGVLDKSQAGSISTAFFIAYGVGQLISGVLADKISCKWMVFSGLCLSILCNLSMGAFNTYSLMLLFWSLNGFSQSLIWAPIIKLFSDRLPIKQCRKACVDIISTVALGTLSAYLISALCIQFFNWQSSFYSASILMLGCAILWFFTVSKVEKVADQQGVVEPTGPPITSQPSIPSTSFKSLLVTSGMLIIAIAVLIHGILKDGVMTWVPTYISEVFKLGSVTSILATTCLPLINLAGAYLTKYLNHHFIHDEIKTAAFLFLVTALSLAGMVVLQDSNLILTIILLAISTSSMLGVNIMLISLIPLYFSAMNKVATITGILNSLAYVGSAISSYGIGIMAQTMGWSFTIFIWFILALIGIGVCLISYKIWNNYKKTFIEV